MSEKARLSCDLPKIISNFYTCLDSLVLHLQLLHDGHFPGGSGVHDFDEDTQKRLCPIQQRGGNGRHGMRRIDHCYFSGFVGESVLLLFYQHHVYSWNDLTLPLHQQDRDLGDEYGWKQVHGDVFRPSSHPLIFSSLIGSGCQIFSVSLIVIIVAMVEDLYTE